MLREYLNILRARGRLLHSMARASRVQKHILAQQVKSLGPWFHNYEIAAGVWTNPYGDCPGSDYAARRWGILRTLLPDVRGKVCLDIGCSSGFFSLKLKELGAAYVLGIDDGEQKNAIAQARFAASKVGLDVNFEILSTYELQKLNRKFDLVLFLGVLYHLRHPMFAMEQIRSVSAGTIILQTITTRHNSNVEELPPDFTGELQLQSPLLDDPLFPALRFIEGTLGGDSTCWFVPTPSAVLAISRSVGFRVEQVILSSPHEMFIKATSP